MPRREPNLRAPAAPLPRQPRRLPQQLRTEPLPAIPPPHRPRADHALAAAQARRALVLLAVAAGGRDGRLEVQDQRADEDGPAPRADEDVARGGAEGGGGGEVAGGEAVDGQGGEGEEDEDEEQGEAEGGGVRDVGVLVDGEEEGGEESEDEGVGEEGEGGLVALLDDGVGDEGEGVGFVRGGGQEGEGEGGDGVVVEEGAGGGGRGEGEGGERGGGVDWREVGG